MEVVGEGAEVLPTDNEKKYENSSTENAYWLMKAEPDSRIEKGVDVKFSIDDLENADTPEPWDGKPSICFTRLVIVTIAKGFEIIPVRSRDFSCFLKLISGQQKII